MGCESSGFRQFPIGAVAQKGERHARIVEVRGATPRCSTISLPCSSISRTPVSEAGCWWCESIRGSQRGTSSRSSATRSHRAGCRRESGRPVHLLIVPERATWCGPCVKELPKLQEIYDRLSPKGLEIVGVSLDYDRQKLERFVALQHITWPQQFDGNAWK